MRSVFTIFCFAALAVAACTPDWGVHRADAGRDAAAEGDSAADEDSATRADTDDDADVEQQTTDTGTAGEADAGTPEPLLDSSAGDADEPRDADVPPADGGCSDGYMSQGGSCRDIDECFEGTHACHITATCENKDGSYDCTCPLGYSGGTRAGFACAPRIAVGGGEGGHKCALLMDGTVRCWGSNARGQLGNGTQVERMAPVVVPELENVALISAGGQSTCAVLLDGTMRCWGGNTQGQLGDGSMMDRLTPVTVPQLTGVVSVSVGGSHTCVALASGAAKCWGSNSGGQIGSGTSSPQPVLTPNGVKGIVDAGAVFAYGSQACAVLRDGSARCWGEGFLGDASIPVSLTPVNVKSPRNVVSIAIGPFHACSLHSDRAVYCWGPSALDGNGSPVAVHNQDPTFVLATAAVGLGIGIYSTCIIQPDGTMAWWDAGTTPAPVNGISHAVAVSASGKDVCEIHRDGSVSCWTIVNARLTPPVVVGGLDLW